MISVILPTYNGEKYLDKSINSVLNQTYKDIELIIVDDCSTDATSLIAGSYANKDKRVKIIRNMTNQKLPKSLNVGFEASNGKYLTWTSDDNFYRADALERMLGVFEKSNDIDIVYTPYLIINDLEEVVGFNDEAEGDIEKLYEGNAVGACFMYKREVHIKLGGYDESKFLVEDYDFWLRAKRYFNYKFLNEYLYYYRVHESSLTETRNEEIEYMTINLLSSEAKYVECVEPGKSIIYKRIAMYYYSKDDIKSFCNFMKILKRSSRKKYQEVSLRIRLTQYINKKVVNLLFIPLSFFARGLKFMKGGIFK